MAIPLSFPRLQRRKATDAVETRAIKMPSFSGSFASNTRNALPSLSEAGHELDGYQANEVIYRCAEMNASAMAALDVMVMQGKDKVGDDPTAALFNQASLDAENAITRKQIAYLRAEMRGEAFIFIDRDSPDSEPRDFLNIHGDVTPLEVREFKDKKGKDRPASLREQIAPTLGGFKVTTSESEEIALLPWQVLWLRYPHFDKPWMPMAPASAARVPAELIRRARDWQANELLNQARPSGVYNVGDIPEEEARRAKAQIEAQGAGAANAGRVLVVGGGGGSPGFSRISLTPTEMSYLDSIRLSAEQICMSMGVPIDLVLGESTYENQRSAEVRWWSFLRGHLRILEAEIDRVLFPDPAKRAFFNLDTVEALRENTDSIVERTLKLVEWDVLTLGEARTDVKRPLFGDERDELTVTAYRASIAKIYTDLPQSPSIDDAEEPSDPAPLQLVPEPEEDTTQGGKDGSEEDVDLDAVARLQETEIEIRGNGSSGAMVGLWLSLDSAGALAVDGGEAVEKMHVTLAYLGKADDPRLNEQVVLDGTRAFASTHKAISGVVGGKGVFSTPDGFAVVGLVDAVGIAEFRADLVRSIRDAGVVFEETHGFTPHVTVAYTATEEQADAVPIAKDLEFNWDAVTVSWGGRHTEIPLTGIRLQTPPYIAAETAIEALESRTVVNPSRVLRSYDRHEMLISRAVERMAERQKNVVLRKLSKERKRVVDVETRDVVNVDMLFDEAAMLSIATEYLQPRFEDLWTEAAAATAEALGTRLDDDLMENVTAAMNVQLDATAKRVTNTTRDQIASELEVRDDQLSQRILGRFDDLKTNRADVIARAVTLGGTSEATLIASRDSDSTILKIWKAKEDSQVRDSHDDLDGEERALDEAFSNGLAFPGDPIGPADEVINCFPAETMVTLPGIKKIYRRVYSGDLVEVDTALGDKIAGTPNHPVLTNRGWVALGALNPSDQIVSGKLTQRTVGNVDVEATPTEIGKIFDALAQPGDVVGVSGTVVDFHGDGTNRQVEIIDVDRLLRNDDQSSSFQHNLKHRFALPSLVQAALGGNSTVPLDVNGYKLATESSMSVVDETKTLVNGSVGHADVHSFASVANRSVISDQTVVNQQTANTKTFSQLLHAVPSLVEADDLGIRNTPGCDGVTPGHTLTLTSDGDALSSQQPPNVPAVDVELLSQLGSGQSSDIQLTKILNIGRRQFIGHVYNAETETGWYTANNLIAHNCRCKLLLRTKETK